MNEMQYLGKYVSQQAITHDEDMQLEAIFRHRDGGKTRTCMEVPATVAASVHAPQRLSRKQREMARREANLKVCAGVTVRAAAALIFIVGTGMGLMNNTFGLIVAGACTMWALGYGLTHTRG